MLVQWLVFQLLFILICIPPAHLWQPALPGTCLDIATVADGFAITSLVTDIAILALPVPLIWLLHLSRGQKTGLTMLFTLGGLWVSLPFPPNLKDSCQLISASTQCNYLFWRSRGYAKALYVEGP